jgi:hypothetical protein
LRLPIAGETTVISTDDIFCFLEANGLENIANSALSGESRRNPCGEVS